MRHLALTLALAAATPAAVAGPPARLLERGAGVGRGVLVNVTGGYARPGPLDPARPTLVVVHGLNPLHPRRHFVMAERYGAASSRAHGTGVAVAGWDWNAATRPFAPPGATDRNAVAQGHALAGALLWAGIDPARLRLVGQSHGGIVAAVAANDLIAATGRRPDRLTLIDPQARHHRILFGALRAGSAASAVDHLWADGPSGFGAAAPYAGVRDVRLPPRDGVIGLLRPGRADHLNAVRRHIDAVGRGGP